MNVKARKSYHNSPNKLSGERWLGEQVYTRIADFFWDWALSFDIYYNFRGGWGINEINARLTK